MRNYITFLAHIAIVCFFSLSLCANPLAESHNNNLIINKIGVSTSDTKEGFKSKINNKRKQNSYIKNNSWAYTNLKSLSLEEKIAQLFMISAYSNKDKRYENNLIRLIKKYKPGGIIFFQGSPDRQKHLTESFQNISDIPLFIGLDAETGLGARLSNSIQFPKQMTLGAIQNDSLIYEMGREIGRELRYLGVHINFAPVVDINNNPDNPVINTRSFGDNKNIVARKCIAYMDGLQKEGIIAVGKHFPGHGETSKDSHIELPVLMRSKEYLLKNELSTFKSIIDRGIKGIMTGHISVPLVDKSGIASSLSYEIVTKLLKKKLNFKGLCFTDAMNMKAVNNSNRNRNILKAFKAGNDIILMPTNIYTAIHTIKNAVLKGEISINEINRRCEKILLAKSKISEIRSRLPYLYGINKYKAQALKEKLVMNSITLIKNRNNLIPLKHLENLKIASLSLGVRKTTKFQKTLELYTKVDHYNDSCLGKLIQNLNKYNLVIICVHENLTKYKIQFINRIAKQKKVILNHLHIPYSLKDYNLKKVNSILLSYNSSKEYQSFAAQGIFGGISLKGKLPVNICNVYKEGLGLNTNKIRLGYVSPELVGVNSRVLKDSINKIVKEGFKKKAMPGCQITLAKKGYVFYRKSFGYYTYRRKHKVTNNTIYDIASITKIVSTTPLIMQLYEENKISLKDKISKYLEIDKKSDLADVSIKDLLLHESGLKSSISIFSDIIESRYRTNLFSRRKDKYHKIKIGENLYFRNYYRYKKDIFKTYRNKRFSIKICSNKYLNIKYQNYIEEAILNSKVYKDKSYRYSDLGYILLGNIIEQIYGKCLDTLSENIYNSLGANYTGYNPYKKFPITYISPSSVDKMYRKKMIQAYTHDPLAAFKGGISGNAGVFSTANDLAKIMQMLLQNGEYGNSSFYSPSTVKLFTEKQNIYNRRGLGFDKPNFEDLHNSPASVYASPDSYGHSGFTGTLAWADPVNSTICIFLSNRTFPSDYNNALSELNIRTRIHSVLYNNY